MMWLKMNKSTVRGVRRRGISTVIGMIIFISVLFTAVVPMYVNMNQADMVYAQREAEVKRLDEQRSREELLVYSYPTGKDRPHELTIEVFNRGAEEVSIVRIWFNEKYRSLERTLKPFENVVLGSYDVNPTDPGIVDVSCTTDRGNVFVNQGGSLFFVGGFWDIDALLVNVLISYNQNAIIEYTLYMKLQAKDDWIQIEKAKIIHKGGESIKSFDVTAYGSPNTFRCIAKVGSTVILDSTAEMHWPSGSNVVWILP
jgi:hypothetical protein